VARKPKAKYKKPYLDSSVFIAWVNNETDIKGVNRKAIADDILNAAKDGRLRVYTSALTIAEVYKMRNGPRLSNANGDRLLAFFESEFILFVDLERRVAEAAHRLCQQHGILPCDGVHLSSAKEAKCDVLLAWDDRFGNVDDPDIKIEEPQIAVGQLSMDKEMAADAGDEGGDEE